MTGLDSEDSVFCAFDDGAGCRCPKNCLFFDSRSTSVDALGRESLFCILSWGLGFPLRSPTSSSLSLL